jgi:ADP-ribosylglycohydrolase
VAKRKSKKRSSGKRNARALNRLRRGDTYTPAELFLAGCGALILVLVLGIVITSLIGD